MDAAARHVHPQGRRTCAQPHQQNAQVWKVWGMISRDECVSPLQGCEGLAVEGCGCRRTPIAGKVLVLETRHLKCIFQQPILLHAFFDACLELRSGNFDPMGLASTTHQPAH